jgi:hypothetical protein
MIYYAHDPKHFDPFSNHWKFTALGKAARHWRYNGSLLIVGSKHAEALSDFHEAELEDLEGLIKAIFGAKEIREAKDA